MAGFKRSRRDSKDGIEVQNQSPYHALFDDLRAELDEHHDRRERIVQASRDVTAQSKKTIFALQRVRDLGRPIHPSIAKQILPMQSTINELFQKLIPDLEGPNAFRYQRSVSPGIQEYMEAVLFQHYLEHQQLMSYETVASTLPAGIMLTYDDYLLGIFDMTGELMRFAITYVAANGYHPQSDEGGATQALLADMQDLRTHLELLNTEGSHGLSREFEQKLKTTRNSVEKVENSVYSITVRGSERPKGWRPDASSTDPPREIDQAIEA